MERKRVMSIVSSDSGYRGEREEFSGPVIRETMEKLGYEVVGIQILPDDLEVLKAAFCDTADNKAAELILTTGGTGFSSRDWTPEATKAVCQREVPGIPEAMRAYSMQFTGRAMRSRAAAGIRGTTLIINLPGSPKAVRECLEYVAPYLEHGLEILTGEAQNCAR